MLSLVSFAFKRIVNFSDNQQWPRNSRHSYSMFDVAALPAATAAAASDLDLELDLGLGHSSITHASLSMLHVP